MTGRHWAALGGSLVLATWGATAGCGRCEPDCDDPIPLADGIYHVTDWPEDPDGATVEVSGGGSVIHLAYDDPAAGPVVVEWDFVVGGVSGSCGY